MNLIVKNKIMKLFKNTLLISAIFISLFFVNLSNSFSQECTSNCEEVIIEIPIDNTPEIEGFPAVVSEPDCGSNFYSQITNRCMKYCDNVNGAYELNESCPASTNNPVTQNTPVYTNPVYTNTGGVNVTYRYPTQPASNNSGAVTTYNTGAVYNNPIRVVATNQSPSFNWGGDRGPAQTYNTVPVYTQSVVTVPNAPRIVCPINYTVNGQECVPNKKTCNDGSLINFYEPCTKVCWSGSTPGQKIPENQTCPSGSSTNQNYNAPVVYNNPVRPVTNNNFVPINWGGDRGPAQTYNPSPATVVNNTNQNKTCPGGYVVRTNEQCPAFINWGGDRGPAQTYGTTSQITNTKVCRDGNTVYEYQICTRSCVDGTVINENFRCPVVQTKHEVITTAATNITNNSAKCNAIADIVNITNTTGYFEYGISSSLGKSTNSGNIGYGDNIYYSNTITNLEPNTKYYCRAVIVNKDGVYKGVIVNFVTGANKKVYVSTIIEQVTKKETISTSIKKSSTKKVEQKKVEVTCKDSEGNTDKLEIGEKFLDMRLDNVSGFISASEISEYRLEYKNRSTLNLENVLIKIEIPEGMSFVSSTDGIDSDGEILIKIGDVKANENKIINFKLKGDKNLSAGKNIIVQANSSYDMLDENGEVISDENSVYSISTVTDKIVNINNKISKESESFWSGWLFKLLLSLLLIIILFILGRNIYKKIIHKRHADRILGHH